MDALVDHATPPAQPAGQATLPASAARPSRPGGPVRPPCDDAPLHLVSFGPCNIGVPLRCGGRHRPTAGRAATYRHCGAGRLLPGPHRRPLPKRRNRRIGHRRRPGSSGRGWPRPPPIRFPCLKLTDGPRNLARRAARSRSVPRTAARIPTSRRAHDPVATVGCLVRTARLSRHHPTAVRCLGHRCAWRSAAGTR